MSNITMKDHRSLFRQLLAGMYDAVLIMDPSGHLLDINRRGKEYFQCETDEVRDKPVSYFIPGVTPEMVQRIRAGLEQARHMMLDANCLRKDGSTFPSEVTVSLIDLMDPGDLVFTIRSTERRRRQIETFRTKENLARISQAALFACGIDGRFSWVNPTFVQMFDLADEDEARHKSFDDLFDDEPLAQLFSQALSGEHATLRLAAQSEERSAQDVEVTLAPDRHGKRIVGVVGSVVRLS